MAKNYKHKLLFTSLMLVALVGSSLYIALIPNVGASEIAIEAAMPMSLPEMNVTLSDIEEKGLPILSNVLSLDMTKYSTTSKETLQNLYLDVVQQENVRYSLQSADSKMDLLCTFVNGHLRKISVLETEGAQHTTKTDTNPFQPIKTANEFLNDYKSYTEKVFYGKLASMLNEVEAGNNLTTILGNTKLEVTNSANATTFRWTYIYNGFEAPNKCVALRYKDGFLKYFVDTWDLHTIGSTSLKISEEEAINIAMEGVKTASWKMGSDNDTVEIKDFTVANAMIWETVFRSSIVADEARNEDALMLYPMYHVWVSLDKFYPGNVYGFNVYVWADTGEICNINERIYTLDPSEDSVATENDYTIEPLFQTLSVDEGKSNSVELVWFALPAFLAVILSVVPMWFLLGKKKKLWRHRPFKVAGVLLCLLISLILLAPVLTVNANSAVRRATIWGAESTGDTSYYGASGRKTADESYWQQWISPRITDYFKHNGYVASNYQGSNSLKYEIIGNISYNEENYGSGVVVVDFDHGIGRPDYQGLNEWHYMFEDNVGRVSGVDPNGSDTNNWVNTHMVYDMDIYDATTLNNTYFAFINTCLSANISTLQGGPPPYPYYDATQGLISGTERARGMPFAWTHRIVDTTTQGNMIDPQYGMSDDGYGDPDWGARCYIGFPWGSASLNQTIEGSSYEYVYWVQDFFYYALSDDISVINALNEASQNRFDSHDFDETDLCNGFDSLWPMWDSENEQWQYNPYGDSTLAVYGNGNLQLYQYFVREVVLAGKYGCGGWSNEDNIIGGEPDGEFSNQWAFYPGSQATIVGDMSWPTAHGNIYLYGEANGRVAVAVSDDGSNWDYIYDKHITEGPDWIFIDYYDSSFEYIAICVYNNQYELYSELEVDSVLVIPPWPW